MEMEKMDVIKEMKKRMRTKRATSVYSTGATDHDFEVRYHDTVVYKRTGDLETLDSWGFMTNTTKNRINDCLILGRIEQRAFKWYYVCADVRLPFEDGMTLKDGVLHE